MLLVHPYGFAIIPAAFALLSRSLGNSLHLPIWMVRKMADFFKLDLRYNKKSGQGRFVYFEKLKLIGIRLQRNLRLKRGTDRFFPSRFFQFRLDRYSNFP